MKYGLEYDVNYTYSKSMDEGSDPERNGTTGSPIINSFSPHQWYAPSDLDGLPISNITANYTAPLPFGKGGVFLNRNRVAFSTGLLGGFQLNGLVHYSSGFPFSAVAGRELGNQLCFQQQHGGHRQDPDWRTPLSIL